MKKWILTSILSVTLATSTLANTSLAATFTDVSKNHWAHTEITNLADLDIISGYTNGTFGGSNPVTRAQAAKIIALALNVKTSGNFTPKFTDVSKDSWAYPHIVALTERGIFSNSQKFNPNAPLTRAQMAKIISEGYKIIVDNNHQIAFRDVTPNNHFFGYITTIGELDITATPPNGIFKPLDTVSRAQMAAFVHRAMKFDANRETGTIYYDEQRRMYIDKTNPEPLPPVIGDVPEEAEATISIVNKHRSLTNAKALHHDTDLSKIAQAKAEDMAQKRYFDHHSPTYGSVRDMLAHFDYKWTAFGENIAKGQRTPSEVVTGWMNSPGHRTNMLSNNFTNIGVGYTTDTNGVKYWVHIFSRK